MKKSLAALAALSTTGMALGQTTTTNNLLSGLLGGNVAGLGLAGIVLLAVIVFVAWRFFFNGGGGD